MYMDVKKNIQAYKVRPTKKSEMNRVPNPIISRGNIGNSLRMANSVDRNSDKSSVKQSAYSNLQSADVTLLNIDKSKFGIETVRNKFEYLKFYFYF